MGLFNWLKPPPSVDGETRALVERVVVAVDPLLKSLPSHERKLAPAVRHAFDYCERLALAIPGPISITRVAFATNPLVHALFGSADDIETMLARSQCVRTHLVNMDGPAKGQCCALLGMRHREKAGFGACMTGEVIRVDEAQKTLYFTDHTLAEPSPDLDATHQRLTRAMFDGLLKGFVAHAEEVRAEHKQMQNEQALQRAFGASPESHTRRQTELRDRLRETADALQPPRLIETLADYLTAPEASLRLDTVKLCVDRAGVIVASADERANADTLRFVELTSRDQRRWVVMIVRIDREEARAAIERLEEARRNIVI
jgi:hypothetical protein